MIDLKDLLACHYNLDEAFDKLYDIDTATWKGNGLLIIRSSICCRKHFVVTPYPSVETGTRSHNSQNSLWLNLWLCFYFQPFIASDLADFTGLLQPKVIRSNSQFGLQGRFT